MICSCSIFEFELVYHKLDKCDIVLFYSIDNFNSGVYLAPGAPIIFSQVNVESFDYGHGMKPMTSRTIEGKENFKDNEPASSDKGTHLTTTIKMKLISLIPNYIYWSFAC